MLASVGYSTDGLLRYESPTPGREEPRVTDVSTLGVVMPVFNEQDWIARALDALREAAERAGWPLRLVVVDDGSTDGTGALLDRMAADGILTVLHQPNRGRFAARLAGLDHVTADFVLLLDSRVILRPDALETLRRGAEADPESAWNAHVDVDIEGNPWAAFWSGLTKVGWRRYFANPRPVSFGTEDFNSYPKGTGAFAAPRDAILSAADGFSSLFSDQSLASDDTKLIRRLTESRRIHIDPGFSCLYHGRNTGKKWLQQGYRRGTTFVDGYVDSREQAAGLLTLLALLAAAGGALLRRRPKAAMGAVLLGSGVAGVATSRSGGTRAEACAVGGMVPAFAAVFGAGFVRGLLMAVGNRDSEARAGSGTPS